VCSVRKGSVEVTNIAIHSVALQLLHVQSEPENGFIKRNLKASPQELKRLAYISLVRSGMEYASTVWDPHLSKDKDSMERVQRRAACWITSSYDQTISVTD